MTPHTQAAFVTSFVDREGRQPTPQEVWDAAIRSYRDLAQPASVPAGRSQLTAVDVATLSGLMHDAAIRYSDGYTVDFDAEASDFLVGAAPQPAQADQSPAEGDERKAFEMWARDRGYQRDELDRCKTGIVGPAYYNLNAEMAWQAFRAGRALPDVQPKGSVQSKEEFDLDSFTAAFFRAVDTRGWSAKQVAEATGVSETTISRMRNHGRAPDAASLAALAGWAGINTAKHQKAAVQAPAPVADLSAVAQRSRLETLMTDLADAVFYRDVDKIPSIRNAILAAASTPAPQPAQAVPMKGTLNLNDPSVQKRLAAQWGYVQGPATAPEVPAHAEQPEAQPTQAADYQRGWDECMALWADHMKRMNEALNKPLPDGWANHAHHIEQNVRQAMKAAPSAQADPAKCPHTGQCHPGYCPCSDAKQAEQGGE